MEAKIQQLCTDISMMSRFATEDDLNLLQRLKDDQNRRKRVEFRASIEGKKREIENALKGGKFVFSTTLPGEWRQNTALCFVVKGFSGSGDNERLVGAFADFGKEREAYDDDFYLIPRMKIPTAKGWALYEREILPHNDNYDRLMLAQHDRSVYATRVQIRFGGSARFYHLTPGSRSIYDIDFNNIAIMDVQSDQDKPLEDYTQPSICVESASLTTTVGSSA